MINIDSLEDIEALRESQEVECKLAQGRDGKGALPNDIWETYSAFANTEGGDIFLGLKENKDHTFEFPGVENTEKVLNEFWNATNNPQKISCNIVTKNHVRVLEVNEKKLIQIHVPKASRKQRPVFINNNPLTGTYKRFGSADMLVSKEICSRMLAEQVEDSRDTEILRGWNIEDLDIESVNAYRNMYSARQPDHPWNKVDLNEFLFQIGAWNKDRQAGYDGVTRAGLLMFGKYRPIMDAFPNYMVDYQERPEAKTEARWIDRVVPDGTWSGNLFDFYNKVIRKLTADLKIPFVLIGDTRQDDTLVHKALREALVNTLIHADYTERASVLIVKRPDMFGFRNPGLMRVSLEEAMEGGQSDCRNRLLQSMFRFIGLGENAGSGLSKIFDGWKSQHWRKPLIKEKSVPSEQTLMELHTLSLVPEKILDDLRIYFDSDVFNNLSEYERLILVTAKIEKTVDHKRMMQILDIHPRDLSNLLSGLVSKHLLYQEGMGRGTIYFLGETRIDDAFEAFVAKDSEDSSGGLGVSSGGLKASSGGLNKLQTIAEPVASKRKASKELVTDTILQLCTLQPCSLDELSKLLNRSPNVIRKDYLQPMVQSRKLKYRFPTIPNHPEQGYITVEGEPEV